MTITDSLFTGNSALNGGGGPSTGTMTITRTTFSENTSRFDVGALDNDNVMTIRDSTFSGNISGFGCVGAECSHAYAGAILNTDNGTMSIDNSTISGNRCKSDGTGMSGGGILDAAGSTLTITSTTIVGNKCGVGPGIGASGVVRIRDTIVANNIAVGNNGDCSGRVASLGYNLVQGCTLTGVQSGNISGPDPLVGPLKDNGGGTFTHALLPGSPAIDKGDPQGCRDHAGTILTADQRGSPRPVPSQGRCDIGAFEVP